MNLLYDLPLLRVWRWLAVRRRPARAVFTVTVPAPLAGADVIELRRPAAAMHSSPSPSLQRVVNG